MRTRSDFTRWLLPIVVAAIAFATLTPSGGVKGGSFTCVFCNIRAVADLLSNMVLFTPLGAALALRKISFRRAFAVGALFTIGIEAAQFFLVPGRHANLGDVLANTAGVVVGYAFLRSHPWTAARSFGLRKSLLTALVANVALLIGLALMTQSLSRPDYSLHWTAHYDGHDQYLGKVLNTRVGPLKWLKPELTEPGDSIRTLLARYPIETRFVAGPPTRRLAPIVSIHDGFGREVIQLGADRGDFVFRYWGAADEVRLDHADLRVEELFADVAPGDTVDLALSFTQARYCVALNERSECGRAFSVADTWSLLISLDWSNARSRAAGMAWLIFVFFPVGFVTSNRRVLLAVIGFSIFALIAGPLLIGFSSTPWYQIAAAVVGLLTGHVLARWVTHAKDDYDAPRGGRRSPAQTRMRTVSHLG